MNTENQLPRWQEELVLCPTSHTENGIPCSDAQESTHGRPPPSGSWEWPLMQLQSQAAWPGKPLLMLQVRAQMPRIPEVSWWGSAAKTATLDRSPDAQFLVVSICKNRNKLGTVIPNTNHRFFFFKKERSMNISSSKPACSTW